LADAAAAFSRSIGIDPNHAVTHCHLIKVLGIFGDYAGSAAAFKRAVVQ
jgi:hypothetical protein